MSKRISRRDWMSRFLPASKKADPTSKYGYKKKKIDLVAVIQGRDCTAEIDFCSTCYDECPEPGAIELTDGIPMVIPELCTGCGICHDVCPAPNNAVLMFTRR